MSLHHHRFQEAGTSLPATGSRGPETIPSHDPTRHGIPPKCQPTKDAGQTSPKTLPRTDHDDDQLAYEGKKLQRERFKLIAAPYYAILDSSGKKVYWSKGGIVGVDEFLSGLRSAPANQQ